jgi:hypothetical protein
MNKLKITESKPPKITPIKPSTNAFKIKQTADKTTIVFVK